MEMNRMLGSGEGFEGDQEQEERGHNPLLVLHMLLQGRYWIAILLAFIFAIAGAAVGFGVTHRNFEATGMLHIRPVISPLLFNGTGQMPMYEQFVQTQVAMLKNERCIDLAMNSPRWLSNGRSNSDATKAAFIKSLDVGKDGEMIRVTFTDPDPRTASDAVAAIIDAYQELTNVIDPDQPLRRQQQLETLKGDYEKKLDDARRKMTELASPYTPDALGARYTYKLGEANQAETEMKMSQAAVDNWKALNGDMSMAATAPATQTVATAPATQPKTYTPEFIARYDSSMRDLIGARKNAQIELDQLLRRVGPNHPLVQQARHSLEVYEDQVAQAAAHWTPDQTPTVDTSMSPADTFNLLQAKALLDRRRFEDSSAEATKLGHAVAEIQEIQAEQAQNIQWLGETKQKLEELRVQLTGAGRILIVNTGDHPVLKDRRIPMAAAAGFGGGVLGFSIIIVWGLLDRRLRTIDQARMSLKQGMRVLGMLPSLPKNLEDPSAASFAALCVHHIRMLLQVMPRLDGHPAIAITSPSPGDGKTSLTMALALSYAASGKSTLLIDCDIVGAGLTRRVNAIIRRRIGQILIRENLLTAAELREALSAAQRTGRKLGEVLVDEGFVDAEQLAKALKQQGETSVGLLDVMRGEVLEDCVAETGTPRLWILPVGSALAEHGATISPEGFRSVLDQARKRFDVILVDTGPVPGAIESSVAASQVDGVVLTVSRGEQGPLVKRAAEHLRDIGGRALGVVFNRASPEDFSSSYSSMSKPSIPERVREKAGADMSALGPVAQAVAGQQRSLSDGKE